MNSKISQRACMTCMTIVISKGLEANSDSFCGLETSKNLYFTLSSSKRGRCGSPVFRLIVSAASIEQMGWTGIGWVSTAGSSVTQNGAGSIFFSSYENASFMVLATLGSFAGPRLCRKVSTGLIPLQSQSGFLFVSMNSVIAAHY